MKLKYRLCGLIIIVLILVGIVFVWVNDRGGFVEEGDTAIKSVKSDLLKKTSVASAHIIKRRGMVNGNGGAENRYAGDDDYGMSNDDRRLLDAIEEGLGDDSLEKILRVLPEASTTTNAEIRSELVDALGWFGVPAMNHLLPFLADPDDDVRQSAIDSWTSSLGEVEDEKMKAGLITAVMQVLNDEDALESMATELTDMDEKLALQVLVDVIEGGKASKQAIAAAREQYEFLTGDEYTTVEAADKWLEENYEQDEQNVGQKNR